LPPSKESLAHTLSASKSFSLRHNDVLDTLGVIAIHSEELATEKQQPGTSLR
jgi:hypothetical protein